MQLRSPQLASRHSLSYATTKVGSDVKETIEIHGLMARRY